MAVVLAHIGCPVGNASIYAVICFFVLSGFLITHLLLKEYDKTGDLSLRRFYVRRALRIFPAFYGFAAVVLVGKAIVKLPIDWHFTLARLTYTGNYYSLFAIPKVETMGHTWSLAVEEQFYLLWPAVFCLAAGNRVRLMKGLIAVIVAVWAYRYVATILNFREDYIFYVFETRADALAIGCLLAIANRENRIPRWLIDWKWVGALVFAVICACCIPGLSGPLYAWAIGAVAFAIALIQSITYSKSFVYRWLESRPMRALGLISYSLYLYHPLAQQLPRNLMMRPLFQVAFSITLATASYLIVERPFLALKGRMPEVSRPVAAVAEQ